jgi:2-aminoadipate transaminase
VPKLAVLADALAEQFGTTAEFALPKGGIFLWLALPEQVDTTALAGPALQAGIAFNPGAEWSTEPERGRHRMRLCFALPGERELRAGIAALAEVCRNETGIPKRSANVART